MNARGRKAGWLPVVASVATVLSLAGCIPVPVPWVEDPAHHRDIVESLQIGTADRDRVVKALGEPLMTREGGRYFVYRWREDRGKLIALWLLPMGPYDLGALYKKRYVLFLEFDSQGMLRAREFGTPVAGKGRGMDDSWYAYCTANGLCLRNSEEHVLMASPAAARLLPMPRGVDGGCLLHVWPAATGWVATDGLSVALAEPPSLEHAWLPPGTFAAFAVPAGDGILRARSPQLNLETSDAPAGEPRSGRYRCEAGEPIYLEIGMVNQSGDMSAAMTVRRVDAATGASTVAGLNRVLLPSGGLAEYPQDPAAHR